MDQKKPFEVHPVQSDRCPVIRNYLPYYLVLGALPIYWRETRQVLERLGMPSICVFDKYHRGPSNQISYKGFWVSYLYRDHEFHFHWNADNKYKTCHWVTKGRRGVRRTLDHLESALDNAASKSRGKRSPEIESMAQFIMRFQLVTGIRFNGNHMGMLDDFHDTNKFSYASLIGGEYNRSPDWWEDL